MSIIFNLTKYKQVHGDEHFVMDLYQIVFPGKGS